MEIPESFPRDPWPASLSGAQPKLAARLINGRYVTGLTVAERAERYAICADLVEQLVAYCRRKHAERPDEPLSALISRVDAAVRTKGWDVSPIELTSCMARVQEQL